MDLDDITLIISREIDRRIDVINANPWDARSKSARINEVFATGNVIAAGIREAFAVGA